MALDPTGIFSHNYRQHRGISWKEHVRCATTADITIATALNAGDTIDGVTLAAGTRVLVKDQSTATQNGIYIAGVTPVRAADMDQDLTTAVPAEEIAGAFVYVAEGTVNAGTLWHTTNPNGDTLGSDNIVWQQFTTGGSTVVDVIAHGNMGSTETFDFTDGPVHTGTLNADLTVTFTGATTGEEAFLRLYFTQDGTGGWDVTWPGSVVWPDGMAPTLDTTAGAVEIIEFTSTDGGTTWYGRHAGLDTLPDHDHSADTTQGGDTLSPAVLNLPATNSPAQTANGQVVWDSDDDVLTVGTGAARRTIGYVGSTTPLIESGSGTSGTSNETSRADHVHPISSSGSGIGEILISDTPSTPLVFADLIQNEAQDDLVYADP